jgi:triosephosphate isomerase
VLSAPAVIGVSLKMYFGHHAGLDWCSEVSRRAKAEPAIANGRVGLFVVPTYLQVVPALRAFDGTPVQLGVQDVATEDSGPFTGEVSAAELAEIGVSFAEIGHTERRRLFGEEDTVVAAKAAAALRNRVTPVICVGEETGGDPHAAAHAAVAQLEACLYGAPEGAVIAAYEPIWAIGRERPASAGHIGTVTSALRHFLAGLPGRGGSRVIYGGSAGPGLLTTIGTSVDGLFLGRFAHDVDALFDVVREAAAQLGRQRGERVG